MYPVDTPEKVAVAWLAVREPDPPEPTLRFPVVVINPVLVIPVWVEVPETVSWVAIVAFPPTVKLPVSLI